jgi:short-subunit dehydrogenase
MMEIEATGPRQEALQRRYGPWAVITGASDGIGRSFAVALAKAGFGVVLVARRETALRDLSGELRRSYGAATRPIPVDLSFPEATTRMERETQDLDVGLFVAAAGFGASGPFVDSKSTPNWA